MDKFIHDLVNYQKCDEIKWEVWFKVWSNHETNMATHKIKPLYLATSIKELNKKAENQKIQTTNPKFLCKSADKLYLAAHDKIYEGDQEYAYVLLLRYFDVVSAVRNSKEYKTNKKSLEGLLDLNKFKSALTDAEKLSGTLRERYQELAECNEDKEDPKPLIEQQSSSSHSQSNKEDQSCKSYLDAEELYNILTGTPDKVVILDTRARRDYTTSHVDTKKFPQWLSVPEEVITNGNLTAFMSNSGKSIWAERGNKRPLIILVDNDGIPGNLDKISPSDKPPILSLKDKLNQVCSVICLHYVFKLN
jgi:ubiquitin carboxyl-terminal hydrolase 8